MGLQWALPIRMHIHIQIFGTGYSRWKPAKCVFEIQFRHYLIWGISVPLTGWQARAESS